MGLGGLEGFWTELTELTKWEVAVKWDSGRRKFRGALAKHCISSLSSVCSVDILFRFFTSFVSCSVFRLSFNSFCYPSVDSGRMASLPGLGLIVFVEIRFQRGEMMTFFDRNTGFSGLTRGEQCDG